MKIMCKSMVLRRTEFRKGLCLLRRFSTSFDAISHNNQDHIVDANKDYAEIETEDYKSLRIAILGMPNVGKSTLINQLICRPVCAASSKCHTTRAKSSAVYCQGKTQLVFVDTPGLVSKSEAKKFKLEESFKKDPKTSLTSADVVGVMQDVGNLYTRGKISGHILELLKNTKAEIPSLLILNKVDKIKNKRLLLNLVEVLTNESGWSNFLDVFMVSALTGDGIKDLRDYFLDSAKPRKWDYDNDAISDQDPERIIELATRARLMDNLPQELPYALKLNIEYFNVCPDGSISSVVLVKCPTDRISKLVLGHGGSKIRKIALEAEQILSDAFKTTVRLKVAVVFKEAQY